jgi:hypothetical protein
VSKLYFSIDILIINDYVNVNVNVNVVLTVKLSFVLFPQKLVGLQDEKHVSFKATDNSMTLSADDIIGFQRAMDNPPSGQALPSQWQGDAFKNKYHLSFSDDPFALFELYRQSCVPGREELHQTQFCSNNTLFLTDALVTPYYPGRAVESAGAKGLLNAISVIAEVSYNFLILENEFELPDDKKEVLLKNMSMVPLSVIALSIPLTNLFTSRGIHSSRDDRRQLKRARLSSRKRKLLIVLSLIKAKTYQTHLFRYKTDTSELGCHILGVAHLPVTRDKSDRVCC